MVSGESWDIEYFLMVEDWFIRKSPRSTTVVKVPLAVAIFLLLQQGLWVTNLCEEWVPLSQPRSRKRYVWNTWCTRNGMLTWESGEQVPVPVSFYNIPNKFLSFSILSRSPFFTIEFLLDIGGFPWGLRHRSLVCRDVL